MKKLLILSFLFTTLTAYAQENPTLAAQPIVEEGKKLYRSEMASWYGTDLFMEHSKDKANAGGYFSYVDGQFAKCIFYSKEEQPKVLATISFDSTYDTKTANLDFTARDFSVMEKDLYEIRRAAITAINSDTLFKAYQNTSLNLIPLIDGDQKKVYVLTGPKESGVVIIGNDYLLTFDNKNKLTSRKQLHKNIIPIYYGREEDKGREVEGAMHSHLPETGDYITATDICTLMLYARFAKWKTHNVVSARYLNTWNCETNQLTVISMEVIRKISEDQKTRKASENKNR